MAQRRKRRSKAEIEAEKQAKAAAAAEAKEMESQGFEKLRHRDEKGHYVKDDPSTPENEAWDWVKKDEDDDDNGGVINTAGPKLNPVRNTQWQTVEHATCRFKEKRGRKRGRW